MQFHDTAGLGVPALLHRGVVRHYVTGAQWQLGEHWLRAQRLAECRAGMLLEGIQS
jgi:hypothetical protein